MRRLLGVGVVGAAVWLWVDRRYREERMRRARNLDRVRRVDAAWRETGEYPTNVRVMPRPVRGLPPEDLVWVDTVGDSREV